MLLEALLAESVPVAVTGADCVRSRCKHSTCQACTEVCAPAAITLTADGITIAPTRCNQCGNCLFACPGDALRGTAPVRHIASGELSANGPAPTTAELLQLYARHGLRRINAETGSPWRVAFNAANRLLNELGHAPLQWRDAPPGDGMSRRGLFRHLARHGNTTQATAGGSALCAAFPGQRFYQIALQADACTLCAACTRICPHAALRLVATHFVLDNQHCTGCKLCQDSCLEQAIYIQPQPGRAETANLPISQAICEQCGRQFARWQHDTSCHICRKRATVYGAIEQ